MADIAKIVSNIKKWDSNLCVAPRTKEHFFWWIKNFFNFEIPWAYEKTCENHSFPLDAMWNAYAEKVSFSIWLANRGGGKTFNLSILTFLESIFKPKCGINFLGGSLEQSQKAIGYLTEFWAMERAPRHLLETGRVAGRGYHLTNGSWVRALAASPKSVRGSHQAKLRIDEVDEVDKKIYDASLGQPKTMHGIPENIIVSSTLHQPFGLMSEIVDNRNEIGAKLYSWCVEEVREPYGFWSDEEIERKKRQTTIAMFESEYLCKRPKIGDTIFDFESVDRAYQRGKNEHFQAKVFTEAGIDWGYSCTALSIVQDPREVFRNPVTKTWEYIELKERCQAIAKLCIKYNITRIYCDSNPKDSNITLSKTLKENRVGTEVYPIAFNKWKGIGINVLRFLLEKNKINITEKIAQEKMKKYHYKDPELGIIDKKDDHIPDSLIAWAASRYRILGI